MLFSIKILWLGLVYALLEIFLCILKFIASSRQSKICVPDESAIAGDAVNTPSLKIFGTFQITLTVAPGFSVSVIMRDQSVFEVKMRCPVASLIVIPYVGSLMVIEDLYWVNCPDLP